MDAFLHMMGTPKVVLFVEHPRRRQLTPRYNVPTRDYSPSKLSLAALIIAAFLTLPLPLYANNGEALIGGTGENVHHLIIVGATNSDDDEVSRRYFRETPRDLLAAATTGARGGTHALLVEPRVSEVFRRLSALINQSNAGADSHADIVVSVFAHGNTNRSYPGGDEIYDEYFTLSRDERLPQSERFLTDDTIGNFLLQVPESIHITFVIDTCYGGGFTGGEQDIPLNGQFDVIGSTGVCSGGNNPDNLSVFGHQIAVLNEGGDSISVADLRSRIGADTDISLGEPDDLASFNESKMVVTYISHGSAGDSTLIKFPGNQTMLIDGGFRTSYTAVKAELDRQSVTSIDILLATHADEDHVNGLLELIERQEISVEEIWINTDPIVDGTYVDLMDLADDQKITVYNVYTGVDDEPGDGPVGDIVDDEPDFDFLDPYGIYGNILSPPYEGFSHNNRTISRNGNSVVVELNYNEINFLFTGDANRLTEQFLTEDDWEKHFDIVNSPHHGANTHGSNSEAFINAITPDTVIYSANTGNRYGHPAEATVERYKRLRPNIKAFKTGDGTVRIETDGLYCTIYAGSQPPESCSADTQSINTLFTYEPPEIEVDDRIEFRTEVGDPRVLTSYRKGSNSNSKFKIYTHAHRSVVDEIELEIGAYDIDTALPDNAPPTCGPGEIIKVYLNRDEHPEPIGVLRGLSNESTITTFEIPKARVNWKIGSNTAGENEIEFELDRNTPKECPWGHQIHYASITAKQYPLVFVPGIMGSELWLTRPLDLKGRHKSWFSIDAVGSDLLDYRLNKDGTGPITSRMTWETGQVMRKILGIVSVYDGLLDDFLPRLGYYSEENIETVIAGLNDANPEILRTTPIPDGNYRLFEFPYDWRYDNRTTAKNLSTFVDEIKDDISSDILLVAHSMGGLISKQYLLNEGGADNTKMLLTMGTPYAGAPKAYFTPKFGQDFISGYIADLAKRFDEPILEAIWRANSALGKWQVRQTVNTFPSIYQLMPDNRYFTEATRQGINAPITLEQRNGLHHFENWQDTYINNRTTRVKRADRARDAQNFKDGISGNFPSNVDVYVAIGTGNDTVSEIRIPRSGDPQQLKSDGDGTVPTISARLTGGQVDELVEYSEEHVPLPNNSNVQMYLRSKIAPYNDDGSRERPTYGIPEIVNPMTIPYDERCREYPELDPMPSSTNDTTAESNESCNSRPRPPSIIITDDPNDIFRDLDNR